MSSSVRESEDFVENACCVCLRQKRRENAEKYCVQCTDYFCSSCLGNIHGMIPANAGHKILEKSDFMSALELEPAYLPRLPTQRCAEHPAKVLDLYCDEVFCASSIIKHRLCKEMVSIPENVDILYSRSMINDMKEKSCTCKEQLEDLQKSKENEVKEIRKSFQAAAAEVTNFNKKLKQILDDAEGRTIAKLKEKIDKKDRSVLAELSAVIEILRSLQTLGTEMQLTVGNKAQEFVLVKTCDKMATKGTEMLKQQKQSVQITVSFIADQILWKTVQQLQLLGQISEEIQERQFVPKTSMYKLIEKRSINVRLNDLWNLQCSIHGSCLTEDGSLLLTDFENKNLKHLDPSTQTVRDHLILKAAPWAVCQTSNNVAAVSLDNNSIMFVSVKDKMNIERTLTINHPCFGLTYHKDKLFITDSGKSVFIHDMKGEELCRIPTDCSSRNMFQQTRHIAVSAEGDRVYVADNIMGLVILDIKGNYLSCLGPDILKASGAWGVCTDGENVFVCDFWSHTVVRIGKDGKLKGQITTVRSPYSLCFDPRKTRLYVTGNLEQVTVLELV